MEILASLIKELLQQTCKVNIDPNFKTLLGLTDITDERLQIEVMNWIRFSRVYLSQAQTFQDALKELNRCLAHRSFLVGDVLTLADVAVWARLNCSSEWQAIVEAAAQNPLGTSNLCHLRRLYHHLADLPGLRSVNETLSMSRFRLPAAAATPVVDSASTAVRPTKASAKDMKFEEGGKFEELPGAKMGEVVVRFPPEASGFLHIGHAKAALINQNYKDTFNGRLLLRFDDTNPTKETLEYETAILEDLPRLGITWDSLTYTSDYFDKMVNFCTQMIQEGKAYADNTDMEIMRTEREQRKESTCRNNDIATNMAWWKEMQAGTDFGTKCCIRAKIDMSSDNGAMRDPTIYRCKSEPHIRTGNKYLVYPTYDFACPIVDSIEGVTHALRTSEYNDRNAQYYWMCDALHIRKPTVVDYSRLALQSTLLSKRKLNWFVSEGLVSGWDDPRMPTVRGILRHGLTPEGLRQFVLAQGSSRSTAVMEWDKIWAFNKKVLDPITPRYTGLYMDASIPAGSPNVPQGLVAVTITGQTRAETKSTPLHPKDAKIGKKDIVLAPVVLVELADAVCFKENENVTFINWGNLRIRKIHRTSDGQVTNVEADLNLEDTDYKKTQKITWLADPSHCSNLPVEIIQLTPLTCVIYGNLISKNILGKDDDFKQFVNRDSLKEESFIGDPQLRNLKRGDIIQLQRKGFYICDEPYHPSHPATGRESPCVLIYIPDGTTKARPTAGSKFKAEDEPQAEQSRTSSRPSATNTAAAAADKALSPEEAAKRAEKERLKEEKKAARKQGREKAKQAHQQHPGQPNESDPVLCSPPPASVPAATTLAPVQQQHTQADHQKPIQKEAKQKAPKATATAGTVADSSGPKKQTRLGMEAKKEENTADWYTQVITKAEMLEYYDVSGCYILRPWSFFIWSQIQAFFDEAIRGYGVDNTYFPMFVSKNALEQEKSHIADFAPEVAWVTKSGDSDMAEPIAIRPTSETIIYPAFAKWIKSHRDLPLKVNQWSNIVRWEFKHPTPFLRTREFLWQEGHTAYADKAEAENEVLHILDLYKDVYEKLLAIPVVKGRKTEREKFPGGDYTTTVEVYIGASGRAIQGATSHHLGQNFSRIFEVVFEHPETRQPCYVYQNSWGITTRTIGVMVMVHADNHGLVLPPRVAKYQAVVVPCGITAKTTDEERERLLAKARDLTKQISTQSRIRVHLDDRDHVSPGWKFNHWELKGVPVRVELGFKDMAAGQVTVVIRYTGEKIAIPEKGLAERLTNLLDEIHSTMLARATEIQRDHVLPAKNMDELRAVLDKKSLALVPFCESPDCEDCVREESTKNTVVGPGMPAMGAKSLCIPFEGQLPGLRTGPVTDGSPCLRHPLCSAPARSYVLFGRSY